MHTPNSALGSRLGMRQAGRGRGLCAAAKGQQVQGAPSPALRQRAGSGAEVSVPRRRSRTLLRTYHSPSTHRSIQRPLSVLCPRRCPRCVAAPIAHRLLSSARRDRPSPPLALTRPMVTPVCPSPPRPLPSSSSAQATSPPRPALRVPGTQGRVGFRGCPRGCREGRAVRPADCSRTTTRVPGGSQKQQPRLSWEGPGTLG